MLEFNDLDMLAQEEIVNDSINLMRSITTYFGAERSLELWTCIADTLGADVKGKVFFSMLIGDSSGDVTLVDASNVQQQQYVELIKHVRYATGMGLKDAKDAVDSARNKIPIRLQIGPVDSRLKRSELIKKCREVNCVIR